MNPVAGAAEVRDRDTVALARFERREDVGRDERLVDFAEDPHLALGVETLAQRAVDARRDSGAGGRPGRLAVVATV